MQYDDHCLMVFNGGVWRISGRSGPLLHLRAGDGVLNIDVRDFRWDEYCVAAVRWMGARHG
jgi:hypothetical protein